MVESLLVPDDLDRNRPSRAVISTLEDLAERSLPEQADDLVPVREVVPLDEQVVAPLVVVAVVVGRLLARGGLLGRALANVVDGRVVDDLFPLKVRQSGVGRLDCGCKA